jgi:hypothetical protein
MKEGMNKEPLKLFPNLSEFAFGVRKPRRRTGSGCLQHFPLHQISDIARIIRTDFNAVNPRYMIDS